MMLAVLGAPAIAQDTTDPGEEALADFGVWLSVVTSAAQRETNFGPAYQFGDDPTEAAQRDDDFAMFDWVYAGAAVFPDGLDVRCDTTTATQAIFCAEGFLDVEPSEVYVVFGGQTTGPIPPEGPEDAQIQYSFPFTYTGAVAFEPLDAFPGDTWQWTTYQPWVQADFGEGFAYNTSQWDGSRFLAPASRGFGWIEGNQFFVVVPASEIRSLSSQADTAVGELIGAVRDDIANFTQDNSTVAFEGLGWASAVHIHGGDFGVTNPSKIQAGPPKPHGPDGLFQGLTDTTPRIFPPLFPQKPDAFTYDPTLPGPAHLLDFEGTGGLMWDFDGLQYGWEPPGEAFDRIILEQHIFMSETPGLASPADALGFDMPQRPCSELGTFLTSASDVACNDSMFDWFGRAITGGLDPGDGLFTITFDFADELRPSPDGDFFVTEVFLDFRDGGFPEEGAGSGADFRLGLSNGGGDLVAIGRRWDSGSESWVDEPTHPIGYQMSGDLVTLWLTRSAFDGGNPFLGVVGTWSGAEITDETNFKTAHGVLDTGGVCPFVAEESFWTAVFPAPVTSTDDGGTTSEPSDDGTEASTETGSFPWLIPLGFGFVLLIAGGWMFFTSRDGADKDCDDEKAAWDAALEHLKEVRTELDEYKRDLDENIANINQARKDLKKAKAAKRTSGSVGDGSTSHPFEGGLITTEGLDQLIADTERLLGTYEAHLPDRQARFDRALIRFDAARDAEQTAREAYAACIGATLSAPFEANDPGPPLEEEAPPIDEPAPLIPPPPVIEFDVGGPPPTAPGRPAFPGEPTESDESEEPSPPSPEPEPFEPVGEGTVSEPRRPPPPPVTASPEEELPERVCDWAFYVDTGSGRQLVRPPGPGAHECCVYVLTISSTPGLSISSSGITPDAAGDDHPRDVSVIAHNAYKGADGWGRAQVRTWPQGAIAAMFGEGWPTVDPSPEDWPPVFGDGAGERPDVGAFTVRPDQTDIMVEFTDGCGGSGHAFAHTAGSRVHVQADQECTNRNHENGCPVELSVSGQVLASATGSMTYPIIDPGTTIASDPDELPTKLSVDPDGHPLLEASVDSHDHPLRDDGTYRFTMSNTSSSPNQVQDTWHGRWTHSLQLQAGLRVPHGVRSTTDRTTASITGDIAHILDLQGSAAPAHRGLADGTCECGSDRCSCQPEFRLEVKGGDATVFVGGKRIASLYRPDDPDPTSSREVVWTTSAPSSFGFPRPEPDRPLPV